MESERFEVRGAREVIQSLHPSLKSSFSLWFVSVIPWASQDTKPADMEFEYIPSTPSSPVLWGVALQTTFKVASLLQPSLIHRKSNKTTSVLYFQPCQLCFSWFTSCWVRAENRTPNQIPGPSLRAAQDSKLPAGTRALLSRGCPAAPLMEAAVPHSCVAPTPFVTQPSHSSSSWARFTARVWGNLSRCLPATGACGREGPGLCHCVDGELESLQRGRGWCRVQRWTLHLQWFCFRYAETNFSHIATKLMGKKNTKYPMVLESEQKQTDSGEES